MRQRKMQINALNFDNGLLEKYIDDNAIDGCFLCKDEWYQVYEGNTDYKGFKAAEFKFKQCALQFIKEWCKHTGLPRFKNFNC